MSQLPSASRPASRSPTDGQKISLPPVQVRDDGSKSGLVEGRGMQRDLENQAAVRPSQQTDTMQPPQASQAATSEDEQKGTGSSRGLGVHNILNPAEAEPSGSSTPRSGTGFTRSPQVVSQTPQYTTNPPLFSQGYIGQHTGTAVTAAEVERATPTRGRKYAPLKSPRSISLGGQAAATRDARQSPFVASRGVYIAEPGPGPSSEVPPMPAPPGPPQQSYGYSGVPGPPRRASVTAMSAPTRTPLSQSASPSASTISSYSHPSQSSPAVRPPPGQPPNTRYFPGQTYGSSMQQRESSPQIGTPGTEGPYTTSPPETFFRGSQRGQNPHLALMPFSNELGEMLIEVDVQAASKVADEKRARNAGASARFRERRKQKEKEANQHIQKLDADLKDLQRRLMDAEHDRDFYRGERDRFREFCFRNPSTREFATNVPPSPRTNRQAAFPLPPSGLAYQTQESGTSQDMERPSVRRRTDDYSFPASSLAPYQAPSYGTGPGPGPGGSQPATTLPPLRMSNVAMATTTGPPTFSNPPLPTTRPPPFDPYPRSGYDRGWPGDGAGGPRQ